ncbi:hypothetical protein MRX96_047147 [Rhipicephalus microplus]
MYTCVRYMQEDERAPLSVKLFIGLKAKSFGDDQKHREYSAYRVDENGEFENFYTAEMTALAGSRWAGILVNAAKLRFIMRSLNETKVAREMARYFWTPAEMQLRSLMGQPCRRQADSVAKLQVTPEKAYEIMYVFENLAIAKSRGAKKIALSRKSLRNLFRRDWPFGPKKAFANLTRL